MIIKVHNLSRPFLEKLAKMRLEHGFRKYGYDANKSRNMLMDATEELLDAMNQIGLHGDKMLESGGNATEFIRNVQEAIWRIIVDVKDLSLASRESTYEDSPDKPRVGIDEIMRSQV